MTENKNLMELCPQLQGILKDTYGVIVYQEQVMKIVQELGGFSMGRADLVRKAMSKKKKAVIEEERQNFVYGNKELGIPGCIANGISEEVANHIYDKMESFAAYAFNKSHAVAYANTSYIAAWLKYHYPAYYLCEVMNYADKIEDIQKIIEDAREFGIKVLPPSLYVGNENFAVSNGNIVFGLSRIKGVGVAAEYAVKNAPYKNIGDFILRGMENTGAFSSLIKAGVFDDMFSENYSRKTYLESPLINSMIDCKKTAKTKETFIKNATEALKIRESKEFDSLEEFETALADAQVAYKITGKNIPTADQIRNRINNAKTAIDNAAANIRELNDELENIPEDKKELLINEKEVLGVFVSGNLIDNYEIPKNCTPIDDCQQGYYTLAGVVVDLKERNGIDFMLEDKTGSIKVHVWPNQLEDIEINEYDAVSISGEVIVDEFSSTEENTVYQLKLNRSSVINKLAEKKTYIYILESADFRKAVEEILPYRVENGNKIIVRSLSRGVERVAKFTVSADIEKCQNITIRNEH